MEVNFLFDTNAASEPYKARPNAKFLRRLVEHSGQVALAAPSWYELQRGLELLPMSKKKERLREQLIGLRVHVTILPYDERAAEWHAREHARLSAKGRPASLLDGQIAAIAWTHALTLVTANVKDFRNFGDLSVVDWTR